MATRVTREYDDGPTVNDNRSFIFNPLSWVLAILLIVAIIWVFASGIISGDSNNVKVNPPNVTVQK